MPVVRIPAAGWAEKVMKTGMPIMILSGWLALATGCASSRPPAEIVEPVAIALPDVPKVPFSGTVIRVNDEFRYVVLQCTILPSIGEEAKVVRDTRTVGRVKVSGPTHLPFTVADILEGTVKAGDEVKQ